MRLLLLLAASMAAASPAPAAAPQVIKLQRFRAALWTVHLTIAGREGDFLFDTGGGLTLLVTLDLDRGRMWVAKPR
jgi:hypothetical protein